MSVTVNLSERQLRIGVFKLALSLASLVALLAVGIAILAQQGQSVAIGALLICVALSFPVNGVLAVLKIVDWFEARKRRHG